MARRTRGRRTTVVEPHVTASLPMTHFNSPAVLVGAPFMPRATLRQSQTHTDICLHRPHRSAPNRRNPSNPLLAMKF